MKKYVNLLLLSGLLWGAGLGLASGQATDKILYGGLTLIKNVGRYNSANFGIGFSGRYQYPLTKTVSVTGKLGLEVTRVNYSLYNYNTYYNYNYNYYTGYTSSVPYFYNYSYDYQGTAVSLPFSFGPRVYFTDAFHADLNVGVDIALNQYATSDLHIEPGVGYTLPLGCGRFLDLNASFFTSFGRGSGAFTIGAAYPLRINR